MNGAEMDPRDAPAPDVLDCGCVFTYKIEKGERQMIVSPCKESCPVLSNLLSEAAAEGKPVEFRVG